MAIKPYPEIEETPCVAKEPSVAYQPSSNVVSAYPVTDVEHDSIMRAKEQFTRGEFYTESEMDKMVAEWLN